MPPWTYLSNSRSSSGSKSLALSFGFWPAMLVTAWLNEAAVVAERRGRGFARPRLRLRPVTQQIPTSERSLAERFDVSRSLVHERTARAHTRIVSLTVTDKGHHHHSTSDTQRERLALNAPLDSLALAVAAWIQWLRGVPPACKTGVDHEPPVLSQHACGVRLCGSVVPKSLQWRSVTCSPSRKPSIRCAAL